MNITYSGVINSGRVPEANIQAEFYMLCRRHGIQALLEVKYENCRFDVLVFNNDRPFAIVEVKNYSNRTSIRGLKKNGRQYKKYTSYNIPLIEVLNSKQIIPKFQHLLTLIQNA